MLVGKDAIETAEALSAIHWRRPHQSTEAWSNLLESWTLCSLTICLICCFTKQKVLKGTNDHCLTDEDSWRFQWRRPSPLINNKSLVNRAYAILIICTYCASCRWQHAVSENIKVLWNHIDKHPIVRAFHGALLSSIKKDLLSAVWKLEQILFNNAPCTLRTVKTIETGHTWEKVVTAC